MPLLQTSGNVTADGYGGGVAAVPNYIEDVFSTYLYTGNGSTQTITNGIDLSTKGGLVWIKARDDVSNHVFTDTARGTNSQLASNSTSAQTTSSTAVTAFNSTGFNLSTAAAVNRNGYNFASWTFREQPKFFDVVTYTGNGTTQAISHNLGSVPGFIAIKRTNTTGSWWCFHRYDFTYRFKLETTDAATNLNNTHYLGDNTNAVAPTSTSFTVGDISSLNNTGDSFVAYIFAHDAGGFGLTGTDNVISCGSFTANGSGDFSVNLGYEPQWLMIKRTNSSTNGDWYMTDIMRGLTVDGSNELLYANLSNAALATSGSWQISSTGFSGLGVFPASASYIYIAIRRGPMKVPTSGTSVFAPVAYTGTGATLTNTTGFPVDSLWPARRPTTGSKAFIDRLRGFGDGKTPYLLPTATDDETTYSAGLGIGLDNNTGLSHISTTFNTSGVTYVDWSFRRAPSFFDEVCYTGTGSNITLNHNLGAVPQLMIFKTRTGAARAWGVYSSTLGVNKKLILNTTAAVANDSFFVDTTPTATVFYPGNADESNEGGNTYVAYLFATCAGVSKVGSYTGNGTTQTINCGFTGGARFVLIKRTDSTGDWYVYDTARGMTTLTDPYLLLNSTAAESATLGSVTTVSTGFAVNASILAAINTNAASYIFLAIA